MTKRKKEKKNSGINLSLFLPFSFDLLANVKQSLELYIFNQATGITGLWYCHKQTVYVVLFADLHYNTGNTKIYDYDSEKITPPPICHLLICLLSVLLITSCKKSDTLVSKNPISKVLTETPENFFNVPANASPVLKRIAAELEKQNNSNEFVTAFIEKEGFPIWSKSRIERNKKFGQTASFDGDGLEDTTVYIPLVVSADQYVTGFLKATVNDSVDIKIYRQSDYVIFPFSTPTSSANVTTAENFAIRMMTMDRDVFGTTEFKIVDKRMFNNSTDYSDTANIQRFIKLETGNPIGEFNSFADGTTISKYQYEVCLTIEIIYQICGNTLGPGNNSNMEGCSYYTGTMSYCTTYESEGGEGNGNPGGGNPGGGGGGATWPFPPEGSGGSGGAPCTSFGDNIVNGLVPIECNPGPGGNPWPAENSQNWLDLLWMNYNILDSAINPCITNTLNHLKTISSKLPALIRNFFSSTPEFEIILKPYTDSNPSCSGSSSCEPAGAYTDPIPSNNKYSIFINEYYPNATDLSMAVTIIHEALHAQLIFWLRQATINGDTARQHELAALYGYVFTPDFENMGSVYNTALEETTQHNAIAALYKTLVGQALFEFAQSKNINVNLNTCQMLAWAGLNNTEAFRKNLTPNEQAYITQMINAERDPYGYNVNGNGGNPQQGYIGHPCN